MSRLLQNKKIQGVQTPWIFYAAARCMTAGHGQTYASFDSVRAKQIPFLQTVKTRICYFFGFAPVSRTELTSAVMGTARITPMLLEMPLITSSAR